MAIAWPSSGIVEPHEFRISPLVATVGGEPNPYHGGRAPLERFHQWHVLITWNYTDQRDYIATFGHFAVYDGGENTFQIPLFHYRTMRGTKTGGVSLSGAHAAGVKSLSTSGGSGALQRGNWIQISSSTNVPRAYVVTAGEVSGVISIRPGLRVAHSSGAVVHHLQSSPDGFIKDSMELADPEFAMSMPSPSPGYFQPFALEFTTALRANL